MSVLVIIPHYDLLNHLHRPLDAVFVVDGVVVQVSRLRPWVGTAFGQADTVIEVPPGELDVAVGDEVRRVESR